MENIKNIRVDNIIIISNIRTNKGENGFLTDLANSIKEVGLIQPISVILNPDSVDTDLDKKTYRLITGHRRYLAVKSLGLEFIPAIELPAMTDADIIEYQLIENIQRETVTPIEESHAFEKLIKENKFTAKQIARSIGKSQRYVDTRIMLNNLIPEVSIHVHSGKLSLQHASLFSQCSKSDQEKLLDRITIENESSTFEGPRELKRYIKSSVVHPLSNAPFDFEDSKLYKKAGSCMKCPKRSGANNQLFENIESEDDCFDPICYNEKVKLFMDKIRDQYKDVTVHFLTDKWHAKSEQEKTGIEYAPFLHLFDMIKGKPMKGYPLKEIGIWIDSTDPSKNGTAVQILTTDQYARYNEKEASNYQKVDAEDTSIKNENDESKLIRDQATLFIKKIMNDIALKVAASDVVKIPEAMLRIIGLNLLDNLNDSDRSSFYKNFGWMIETSIDGALLIINHENAISLHTEKLFHANIYRYTGRDLNEVIIYLMLLEIGSRTINCNDIDTDFIYAVEMAQEMKIDVDNTLAAIEKEKGIELKKYFSIKR